MDQLNQFNQLGIPQSSQPSFQPQPPKKFSLPRWVSILIAAAVVVIVGLVSWVAYRAFVSRPAELPNESPEEKQVSPLPAAEEITPTDETANWQTYRNEGYRFEIKYPDNWIINQNQTLQEIKIEKDKEEIIIQINPERTQFVRKEFLSQGFRTIDGYRFEVKSYGDILGIAHVLFIEQEGSAFIIQTIPDFTSENSDLINQILSTFKFIK